jgi:flagellar P-ring protein precursor FlgI
MKHLFSLMVAGLALVTLAPAQATNETAQRQQQARERAEAERKRQSIREAEQLGVRVELAAIGGFRGARSNVIIGYGLVTGLNGTGDSQQVQVTSTAMANALSRWGTLVNERNFRSKNIAIVAVTAELPAFAAPGRRVDVTVQSLGDAKSLEGGILLPTPLGTMVNPDLHFAVASGAVSIGGFNAGSSGSSVRKNHPTVGRIPNGADVQKTVPTQTVFNGNTLFFDLDQPDFTTAQRVAEMVNQSLPGLEATALDGVTVQVQVPEPDRAVEYMSNLQKLQVFANTIPTVVINERTGTIVVGGNVRLGPAIIAHGSLQVRIETDFNVSQPNPLSGGETVVTPQTNISAEEDKPEIALVAPTATLEDLARVLQTLNLSARDIIAILQALAEQGALKARIRIQ